MPYRFFRSRTVNSSRNGSRIRGCFFDSLESRTLLTTYTVTSLLDSGTGTLRAAIASVNGDTGTADTIDFNITPGSAPYNITLASPLPAITNKVMIDGSSQPGFSTPVVMLDGATTVSTGLSFSGAGASNSQVIGLAIGRFTDAGIQIQSGAAGITITGNYIGLDTTGSAAPNGTGVSINGSASTVIGGLQASTRNIISANKGAGIQISGTASKSNVISGNYIGTDPAGAKALGNLVGVQIDTSASANTIGGTSSPAANVISGNTQYDVLIDGATSNTLTSNIIGLQQDGISVLAGVPNSTVGVVIQNNATLNTLGSGTAAVGNVISGHTGTGAAGVWIRGITGFSGTAATANSLLGNIIGLASDGKTAVGNQVGIILSDGTTNNAIGGASSGNGNTISGNLTDGVQVNGSTTTGNALLGNLIGTASDASTPEPNSGNGISINGATKTLIGGTGTGAANTIAHNGINGIHVISGSGNSFLRNSIFSNTSSGILLDSGANNNQSPPLLTSVSSGGGKTVVNGSIQAAPNSTYTIDIFSDPSPDASGSGEGKTYLATAFATTNASGFASYSATSPTQVANSLAISALATSSSAGDTSAFSKNLTNVTVSTAVSIAMTSAAVPPTFAGQAGAGSFNTYTITITNSGSAAAPAVTVVDTLPAGVTFVGSTAPEGSMSQSGQAVTFTLGTIPAGGTST